MDRGKFPFGLIRKLAFGHYILAAAELPREPILLSGIYFAESLYALGFFKKNRVIQVATTTHAALAHSPSFP